MCNIATSTTWPLRRVRDGVTGVVEREQQLYQQLQIPKALQCDEDGRNCKFREMLPVAPAR